MNGLEIFCCVFFAAGLIALAVICIMLGRKR